MHSIFMYGKETNFLPDVWEKIYFSMLAYALLAFPEYINKISYHAGLLNFKKSHGDSDCSYGELFAWYSVSRRLHHVWS